MVSPVVVERFWSNVAIGYNRDDCWRWAGPCSSTGYGQLFEGGVTPSGSPRLVGAHRFSYELHRGEILSGQQIHHTCENTLCVNPRHLQVLTCADHARRHHIPSRARHGTTTRYRRGCRCDDCRAVVSEYHRARREEAAVTPQPPQLELANAVSSSYDPNLEEGAA